MVGKLDWSNVDKEKEYVFLDSQNIKEKYRNQKGKFYKIHHGSPSTQPFGEFLLDDGRYVLVKKNEIQNLIPFLQ